MFGMNYAAMKAIAVHEVHMRREAERRDVWLKAWTAVANTMNGKQDDCTRFADACLKAFDERFFVNDKKEPSE
jgi:hypothetical protein